MQLITALIAGLLFGFGLLLSGMINPQKVLAFLDITGRWDPSLAFVMLGAIPVAAVGFRLMRLRERTFLGERVELPQAKQIDAKLVAGAALFGIGWGLVGYCPGPALAALGAGQNSSVMFIAAMIVGILLHRFFERWAQRSHQ